MSTAPAHPRPHPRRAADAAWDTFTHRLAGALVLIQPGMFLVLNVRGTDRYVQFSAGRDRNGGAVRVEATGEYYMAAEDPGYTDAQRFRLRALGWKEPNLARDAPAKADRRRGAAGNWHVILRLPADVGPLAQLATRTLRGVFGARSPKDLVYDAFRSDGIKLVAAELGIERVDGVNDI